jgi:hypothetical protein
LPVLERLSLVKLGPGEHEPQLASCEIALDHVDLVNSDLGVTVSVPGMEVRVAVIVELHRDRDPEEAADSRHVLALVREPSALAKEGLAACSDPGAEGCR